MFGRPIDVEQSVRNLDKNVQHLGRALDQHAGMLNQHQAFIAKETAKQIMQAEKDLISHSIDRGKLYTQGILAGGYAGFFAFWGFMSGKMNDVAFVGSGLLMAISLAIFVSYNVWANIASNRMILKRLGAMLEAGADPEKYLQIKSEYDEKIKDWHRWTFGVWNAILVLTVLLAALSVAILFYSFVVFLLQGINWNAFVFW
jgi:hypothetical protein